MQYKRKGDYLVVRLEPGDEVHTSLLEAARASALRQGVVISGIGQLDTTTLGFFVGPGEGYSHSTFTGAAEVLALAGNVCEKDGELMAHLHAVLGRDDYSVFGGHLVSGQVSATLEVLMLAVPDDIKLSRRIEHPSGLAGLFIE